MHVAALVALPAVADDPGHGAPVHDLRAEAADGVLTELLGTRDGREKTNTRHTFGDTAEVLVGAVMVVVLRLTDASIAFLIFLLLVCLGRRHLALGRLVGAQ